MAVDARQVVAAFLTIAMFVMLGSMIKRDHFDNVEVQLPLTSSVKYGASDIPVEHHKGPWKEDGEVLKPCWNKSASRKGEQSKGFITFSLTNGPEYHVSQIADAVVIARYLGGTLVLPDIRGSKPGDKRNFEEVYDVEKFVKSLEGVIVITVDQPAEILSGNFAVARVPNRVSEDHIAAHIEPLFRAKGNLRLATYFPSVNMKKAEETEYLHSFACLGMFGSLQLQPEMQEVVDLMVERLRTLSRKSNDRFIAVDLRVEMLENKGCKNKVTEGKSCYNAQEIGEFLMKIGFNRDTTVYLTQSGWYSSLDALKKMFPKTYTKEGIMPADKKVKFLSSEFEKVIDFHICSQSDIFVPAISGLFYANVAGRRIASANTQTLVPAQITTFSASATDYISPYIYKKNHFAYSCFC